MRHSINDIEEGKVQFKVQTFSYESLRNLTDGTKLVSLTKLADIGATVKWRRKQIEVIVGDKRAEVKSAWWSNVCGHGREIGLSS